MGPPRHPQGDVNLHVRVVGSPNERLALLFRDYLRAYPLAVAAYSQFKMTLAEHVDDLDSYSDIKDPVVDLVVAAAAAWPATAAGSRTGASPHRAVLARSRGGLPAVAARRGWPRLRLRLGL